MGKEIKKRIVDSDIELAKNSSFLYYFYYMTMK